MDAAIAYAHNQNYNLIRLVQSPSHIRSFVLYTKVGFALGEPLFLVSGNVLYKDSNSTVLELRRVETDKTF